MSGLQFQNDQQQAGQTQQQPAGGNPFEQNAPAPQQHPQQQQPAPAQGNPFEQGGGNQQPPAQGNPFGQTQQPPAGGNPFEQGGPAQQQQPAVNPMEQQQNIQRDVAAPPPPTANQAFAAHGVAMGSENPTGGGQPPQQQAPASTDSGWQTPAQKPIEDAQVVSESGPAHNEVAASAAAAGMVPLYTFVPADKLDKVMSAIGRAVKDK